MDIWARNIAKGTKDFDFSYSPALKKKSKLKWNETNLDAYLEDPQAFASGTSMVFPGIPDRKDREDLISFLRGNK